MKQGFHRVGRRTMSRVALAGMLGVGLTLAGCGGNEDEDETKADGRGAPTLRPAYDRLVPGMTSAEIVGLIGQQPQTQFSQTKGGDLYTVNNWSDYSYGGQENLAVWLGPDGRLAYAQYVLQGDQVTTLKQCYLPSSVRCGALAL